jgi:hypothetical protein
VIEPREWYEVVVNHETDRFREADAVIQLHFENADDDALESFFAAAYQLIDTSILKQLELQPVQTFEDSMYELIGACLDLTSLDSSIDLIAFEYYHDYVASSSCAEFYSGWLDRPDWPIPLQACKFISHIEGPSVAAWRNFDAGLCELACDAPTYALTSTYCDAMLMGAYLRAIKRHGTRTIAYSYAEHDSCLYSIEPEPIAIGV